MSLTYIASVTASASATLSFTSGIDSTYNEYQFHFANMHPATDEVWFQFQVNADGASGFNETITSTAFKAEHNEADSATGFGYNGGQDQAQGTAYQQLSYVQQIANDEAYSGVLTVYDPSSTTYVKHFISVANTTLDAGTKQDFHAGYINTTSAITQISFKTSSGTMDAGTIKMFGVS